MKVSDILLWCIDNKDKIRWNGFAEEVGKKISKYIQPANLDYDLFCPLAYYFYGDINNCSVIVTRDMFKVYEEYEMFCYNSLIDKKNTRCINCIKCNNCTDCKDCISCSNCVGCVESILLYNCSLCTGCINCDHCVQSKYISDGNSMNSMNNSIILNRYT